MLRRSASSPQLSVTRSSWTAPLRATPWFGSGEPAKPATVLAWVCAALALFGGALALFVVASAALAYVTLQLLCHIGLDSPPAVTLLIGGHCLLCYAILDRGVATLSSLAPPLPASPARH